MTAVSDALAALIDDGRDLTEAEASTVLEEIMSGASIPATQIAALLTALRKLELFVETTQRLSETSA